MEILILGGAGFIGSNIVAEFLKENHKVTVIDGLLSNTGGSTKNLSNYFPYINFISSRIEEISNLKELVKSSDLIIDSMAWTSHLMAIANPDYDLELNCSSHLSLIKILKELKDKRVFFLGSRGQYGSPNTPVITEETPMIPEDVQGIHKVAAESYYRIYSKLYEFNTLSLRIPNVFGINQPVKGDDIGLVGSFIRMAVNNETIEVFGLNRSRSLLYVGDLAKLILGLSKKEIRGFEALNLKGYEIKIQDLAQHIIDLCGSGKLSVKEIPEEIKKIDIGNAEFSIEKAERILKNLNFTDIDKALVETIKYFKEN